MERYDGPVTPQRKCPVVTGPRRPRVDRPARVDAGARHAHQGAGVEPPECRSAGVPECRSAGVPESAIRLVEKRFDAEFVDEHEIGCPVAVEVRCNNLRILRLDHAVDEIGTMLERPITATVVSPLSRYGYTR